MGQDPVPNLSVFARYNEGVGWVYGPLLGLTAIGGGTTLYQQAFLKESEGHTRARRRGRCHGAGLSRRMVVR
jgi:hypothetical protein